MGSDVWKLVIVLVLLICNIMGDQIVSMEEVLGGTPSSVHDPEDYPEGFADSMGKGAIEMAPNDTARQMVETWPETMAPLLEDGKDYATEANDVLFLPNDYVPDPANVTGELIELPTMDLYHRNCTIPFIDPNSQPSSAAFDVRGIVDDCASECASEAMYQCSSYTFGGPGTYCVLHGPIDYGQVFPEAGSAYSITDMECVKNGLEHSSIQLCQFDQLQGIKITPSNMAVSYRQTSVINKGHCELLCNMRPYLSVCTSFAFNPDVVAIGENNCVLFSRNVSISTKFPKGDYDVYENPCYLSEYANI